MYKKNSKKCGKIFIGRGFCPYLLHQLHQCKRKFDPFAVIIEIINFFNIFYRYFRKFCHETNSSVSDCIGIFDVMHKCNDEFVNHAMNLSEPFKICTDNYTFMAYRYTMKSYNLLSTTHDPKNASVFCSEKFLNKNRMNMVNTIIGTSRNLWDAAHCDNCYDDPTSISHEFSNNTNDFLVLVDVHEDCIQKHTSRKSNNSVLCSECSSSYLSLNSHYERSKKTSANKVCFDLEDKVRVLR